LEDVPAPFSSGGDDGAERDEVLSGVESPEGAGDFHLHLHHAQRLFGEAVGEGRVEVDEEGNDCAASLLGVDAGVIAAWNKAVPIGLADRPKCDQLLSDFASEHRTKPTATTISRSS
jgi:hypothetical protein